MNLGYNYVVETILLKVYIPRNAYDVTLNALDKLKYIMDAATKLSNVPNASKSLSTKSRYVFILSYHPILVIISIYHL